MGLSRELLGGQEISHGDTTIDTELPSAKSAGSKKSSLPLAWDP